MDMSGIFLARIIFRVCIFNELLMYRARELNGDTVSVIPTAETYKSVSCNSSQAKRSKSRERAWPSVYISMRDQLFFEIINAA